MGSQPMAPRWRVWGWSTAILILPSLISHWCLYWLNLCLAGRKPSGAAYPGSLTGKERGGKGARASCRPPEAGRCLEACKYRGMFLSCQWTWSSTELFPTASCFFLPKFLLK